MCGRLTITTKDKAKLTAVFPNLVIPDWPGPRYNVAPSQDVAAILNERPNALAWVRWGLIPRWAKDAAIGNKLINARAETLAEKPSFRDAFAKRRCLILADGFYEWAAVPGQKTKQPYFIRLRSGGPFAFAGLWERWRAPDENELTTCTIITTTPNEMLAKIHDRMPVILTGDACDRWLAPGPPPRDLLATYSADSMEMQPVSTMVNNARHEDSRCVEAVPSDAELI